MICWTIAGNWPPPWDGRWRQKAWRWIWNLFSKSCSCGTKIELGKTHDGRIRDCEAWKSSKIRFGESSWKKALVTTSRGRPAFGKTTKTSSSSLLPHGDIHSDRAVTSSNIDVRVNFTSGDPPGSSNNLLSPNVSTMNSSSAPQSRSGSFKRLTKPKSVKDLQEMHRDGSQRRVSVNLEEVVASKLEELKQLESDNCCVVRSFVTSPKGLVNRGDSFKRKPFQFHQAFDFRRKWTGSVKRINNIKEVYTFTSVEGAIAWEAKQCSDNGR